MLDALVDIRRKIDKDLWVTEAVHGNSEHSLVAAPFYLPTAGWHLPKVYSFVVTEKGVDTQVLKEQFTSCLEMDKFANPPCTGCRFSTAECLKQYNAASELRNSVPAEITMVPGQRYHGGYHTQWGRLYESVPGVERVDAPQEQFVVATDVAALESSVRAMLRMSAQVHVIDDKYSYADASKIFAEKPLHPAEIDLSPYNVHSNKQQLRDRSLASAASRRAVREECPRCLIKDKCAKIRPARCDGAITELDQIRETLKARVVAVFGKLPLITDRWVQATLKLSGESVLYRGKERKSGRPANVTPVLVLPVGATFSVGMYYGAKGTPCTKETLVLQHRGGHLHVPFDCGDFTNYKADHVRSLLDLPDVILSEDTLLRTMFLFTTSWIRVGWGGTKCLNYVYARGDSVQVGFTGRSRYSNDSWTTNSLADMHIPAIRLDLRHSVKR